MVNAEVAEFAGCGVEPADALVRAEPEKAPGVFDDAIDDVVAEADGFVVGPELFCHRIEEIESAAHGACPDAAFGILTKREYDLVTEMVYHIVVDGESFCSGVVDADAAGVGADPDGAVAGFEEATDIVVADAIPAAGEGVFIYGAIRMEDVYAPAIGPHPDVALAIFEEGVDRRVAEVFGARAGFEVGEAAGGEVEAIQPVAIGADAEGVFVPEHEECEDCGAGWCIRFTRVVMVKAASGGVPAVEAGAVRTYPYIVFRILGEAGHLVAAEACRVGGAAVDIEIEKIPVVFIHSSLGGAHPEDAGAVFEERGDGVVG